jgi:predicted kinase
MRQFSVREDALFRRRVEAGLCREGHGDLRCEHICLDRDVLQIFDCVEFNPAIRCADIASDLAFLTMDLQRLGQPALARDLLAAYAAHGMDIPDDLHRFYQAHRALVRAKSACLAFQGDGSERDRQRGEEANAYLDLATRVISEIPPALIVMTGLSGTGKSTVAGRIGALLGARVVASDTVRKELTGVSGAAPSDWQEGIYTEEWSERTYERLLEIADDEIAAGRPVVLDAAFLSSNRRRRAAELAATHGVSVALVETRCADDTALARIAWRQRQGDALSDADREIHLRQRDAVRAHPPEVPDGAVTITVETGAPAEVWLDDLLAALDRASLIRPSLVDPADEPGR